MTIARWFQREAERAETTLTELPLFGLTLVFGGNGTLFRPTDVERRDGAGYAILCLHHGISSPTTVFYRDPYLDEEEKSP